MNRLPHVFARLAVAVGVAAAAAGAVSAQDLPLNVFELTPRGGFVVGQPYSAETVSTTTQVLNDGTRIQRAVTGQVYRDSAGRTRREQTVQGLATLTPSADAMRVITITDPVDAVTYTVDERTRTVRRAPLATPFDWTGAMTPGAARGRGTVGGAPGAAARGVGGGALAVDAARAEQLRQEIVDRLEAVLETRRQAGVTDGIVAGGRGGIATRITIRDESLGTREMEGLTVTGRRRTQTLPVGQIGNDRPIVITDERWESLDLQLLVMSLHQDPRTGSVEYRLRNVLRAEPPATLFTVPPGYRELAAFQLNLGKQFFFR